MGCGRIFNNAFVMYNSVYDCTFSFMESRKFSRGSIDFIYELISEQKYNEMYEMIDVQNSGNISQEDFVQRNSAIYEGIEVRNMKIQITEYKEAERTVYYESSFDTIAGSVSFDNEAVLRPIKTGIN